MKEQVLLSYIKGIRNTPSDMLSEDGELAECVNLEVKGNELVPVEMPSKLHFTMEDSEVLILVHNLPSGSKNYASLTNGVIRFFSAVFNTKSYISEPYTIGELKSIQAIGNTVVAYTENEPHYFLYSDGSYKSIGSRIPEIEIEFQLKGTIERSEKVECEPYRDDTSYDTMKEDWTNLIIPEVNKFIGGQLSENKFLFPFFVRYAYKLYDGSYVMHSAPILMLPSTLVAPLCPTEFVGEIDSYHFEICVASYAASLEMRWSGCSALSDWKDIVKGVDIFISKQVYTYDQEGEVIISRKADSLDYEGFSTEFVGSLDGALVYSSARHNISDTYDLVYQPSSSEFDHVTRLPIKNKDEIVGEIASCSTFYLFAQLDIDRVISGNYSFGTIESNDLVTIDGQPTLKDDYLTHDLLMPQTSFVYNGRLNISNITRKLFSGFSAEGMTGHIEGTSYYDVYTYIRSSNGGNITVKKEGTKQIGMDGSFLFYPDSDAYKMVIVDTTNYRRAEVELKNHPLLNGAYWFNYFNPLTFVTGVASIATTDNVEYLTNTLMLSEVNNPFYFPLEGIYTVGSSSIIGVAAVTRPISQGQFGEFPMIAFCTDGNYALRVDEQGFYSGISPVQEDIVLGHDKVVSMENSIAVITQKGIMLTSGNEMTPLAKYMKGGVFDNSVLASLTEGIEEISLLINNSRDTYGFIDYLRGSRMAFDYASNRILIYNPDYTYSYFYNFESDTVTKFVLPNGSRLIASVLDYPDTLLQDAAGNLYSLYEKTDVNIQIDEVFGFALTRPLKLGKALSFKSIMEVKNIEEASSENGFVKYRLYGTNDNRRYYHVRSRFGKPYKYYRLAIYTKLLPKDAFVGTALTVNYRRTHKFR